MIIGATSPRRLIIHFLDVFHSSRRWLRLLLRDALALTFTGLPSVAATAAMAAFAAAAVALPSTLAASASSSSRVAVSRASPAAVSFLLPCELENASHGFGCGSEVFPTNWCNCYPIELAAKLVMYETIASFKTVYQHSQFWMVATMRSCKENGLRLRSDFVCESVRVLAYSNVSCRLTEFRSLLDSLAIY